MPTPSFRLLSLLMLCSGCTALTLEMVWLRRLSLQLGSAGLSATVTLAIYMGGLGLGSWLAGQKQWTQPLRTYGLLELFVGIWAFVFPWLLSLFAPTFQYGSSLKLLLSLPLLLPPALAHGATLPVLSSVTKQSSKTAWLYALNTFGAVLGVLGSAFIVIPTLGVRGTELFGTTLCLIIFAMAMMGSTPLESSDDRASSLPPKVLIMVGVTGLVSMSLEVIWSRLGALLIGGSVYAFAVVLAVFLVGIALGSFYGRRLDADKLAIVVTGMGICTLIGCYSWRWLPHGLAMAWDWFGEGSLLPAGGFLLGVAMAGAPFMSGVVFSVALKHGSGSMTNLSGKVLTANTIGGVIGVMISGPFLMPTLGIVNTTIVLSTLCVLISSSCYWERKQSTISIVTLGILIIGLPKWDVAVYATGLYNRIGEFVDLSPRAIEQFAHEGWEPQFYVDGHSASVAVGQSTRTQNLWLSINGKVDASTGADMPTQVLSGELPLKIHAKKSGVHTMVVGLASGVTANESYKHGASPLTVIELEPSIVEAAKLFHSVNDGIVTNPAVDIRVADARAVLQHESTLYDVIISEPSNPWITGVSNLFTVDYWLLGRSRLREDGVFCQWVQLYALPPDGMRSLMASFIKVFPNAWLFETIPGSDALLIAASTIPDNLPIAPTLGPMQLRKLAEGAPLNTDNHPWIEFEAPKWVNRPTGTMNREIIESAAAQ